MTDNQRRFLELGLNGWASVRGSTLIGTNNGRGRELVLQSLMSRGLLERRSGVSSGLLHGDYGNRTPYDEIQTTDEGKKALEKTPVTDPLLIEIIETT